MKKFLLASVPVIFLLGACGSDEDALNKDEATTTEAVQVENEHAEAEVALQGEREWEVDERLQEPDEHTICEMCNMKVYMKEEEMGVFSAQAVKTDGSIAFYDDIGCLLNAEYAHKETNEKFVRDYTTLNWINVEEAYGVKTSLKSPMNWGYIFFKYEEDALNYITENSDAVLAELETIREEGITRYEKKHAMDGSETHEMNTDMHGEASEESHNH
ncbi:nitrous oxide reductase accessory protein NosL [Solibacillus sp. FSL H8-0538]|uniref:nitrous oxide reductase accessory protein NosL n=1 Tax=Solibacillus sp. FSL H8-0538 TaxID=2921400 RepID=UPI0030FB1EB8